MEHEIKKVAKMIDEIVTYFLYTLECPRFDLNYTRGEDAFRLDFSFHGLDTAAETIEEIRENLSRPRQPELEDYYWQLAGETQDDHELALVSMMTDDVQLDYSGDTLRLRVQRNR